MQAAAASCGTMPTVPALSRNRESPSADLNDRPAKLRSNHRAPDLMEEAEGRCSSKSCGASESCTKKDGLTAIGGWPNRGDSEIDRSGVVFAARDRPCPNFNCPFSPMG